MASAAEPPKKVGPMPTGRRWRNIPVPFFFHEESAEHFGAMEMRDSDVIMSSLGKGGTTWVHKILYCLLFGIDDEGNDTNISRLGRSGQVYPEALPMEPPAAVTESTPDMEKFRQHFFGSASLPQLLDEPEPRLISTHLYGDALPAQLTTSAGKGRLVLVLRNLKDVLASLHFFRGEAKDGWYGNEHGPGSLARYLSPECPNAYGSVFDILAAMDKTVEQMGGTGRVHVVYFEALKERLPSEVDRLAAFLGLTLTAAKKAATIKAVGFDAMKSSGSVQSGTLLRKGSVGDWKNHMSAADWARFDEVFEERLGDVGIAQPLRFYQQAEVTGMPPARSSQGNDVDPRSWPAFIRATLQDGFMIPDALISARKPSPQTQTFQRPPSEFNHQVQPLGWATEQAPYVAEAGRYHLFVSGVCPWASSARVARMLMGLEAVVGMDVADGQSSAGWVFNNGVVCSPWEDEPGPFFLHQVYQSADPGCTTRITMPVLWDTKTCTIVSNDSWNIVKMFSTVFAPLGTLAFPTAMPNGLLPVQQQEAIEELHASIYKSLLNAVYRSGIGLVYGNPSGAAAAAEEVYGTLDMLEQRLTSSRFLMGAELSAVDLRLIMTLLRFDSSYTVAFGLGGGKGGILIGDAYPALQGYIRDIYSMIGSEVDWPSFRQYYRWGPAPGLSKDAALPPLEPLIASAEQPHGGRNTLCSVVEV